MAWDFPPSAGSRASVTRLFPGRRCRPSTVASRVTGAFLDRWGDIIHFLDDDVEVPPFLFRETLDRFRRDPGLVGLGGPNLTPVDSPWREHAFGAAMTSPFAAPLVRARYEGKSRQIAGPAAAHRLILCTLAVRRAAIPQDLTFRDRLLSNEENLFFHACAERGLKLAFCPRLYVYHARRPYLGPFARQLFKYGSGRGQQGRLCWRSSPPLFYAPAIAWALAIGLVGIARTDWLAAVLAVYALGSFLGALASPTARALGFRGVIAVTSLTPLVHGAYGLGLWWGAAGAPSWDLLRRIPARASWRIWRDWVGVARPLHQEG
jgi:hypothetical protein